jgi:hypothetical protein
MGGWTLRGTARRVAGPERWSAYEAAVSAWEAVGSPKRFMTRDPRFEGEGAEVVNANTRAKKALYNAVLAAERSIRRAVKHELMAGNLVAAGRIGNRTANLSRIPASAWNDLKILSLRQSRAEEPTPAKAIIFDIRVFRPAEIPRNLKQVSDFIADNWDDFEPQAMLAGAAPHASKPNTDPEDACYEWLAGEMKKSLRVRIQPKTQWKSDARNRWPTISKRAFLRIWDRALGATGASWNQPGALLGPRRKSAH